VFDKLAVGADLDLLDDLREMPFGIYGHLADRYGVHWSFEGFRTGCDSRRVNPQWEENMPDPLSPEGLEGFAEVAARHVGPDKIPGLVALVSREDHVHVETLGFPVCGGRPVRRDSLFRIAVDVQARDRRGDHGVGGRRGRPVGRPGGEVVARTCDRRVLRRMGGPLDDTVPAARTVTTRDLLTFTFGFGMLAEMFMAPQPWPVAQAATDLHLGTIARRTPKGSPIPTPGSPGWAHCL